ncbi:polyketide cyclase [Sphingopyxis lindanitolerans]|uniref:Polyketide cyclase n=1 Tax=Sphingopyxis lindanitolerans TaxID=2054227 RepID=A0A2S8B6H4_9SPHN|nr:nuclear transport factor 2 family protein [Sphingopyxis lindanitolerans]PQM28022.1 polyketide cyclase [Sphingopyxis lindanitolerans]
MTADDYFAIQRLINLYFLLVDEAGFDAAGALFDRAEILYTATGRRIINDGAAVAALMRGFVRLHGPEARPLTRHHSGNLIIESDGDDRAAARCSAIIFQAADDFPLQPIAEASYADRFAKGTGGWYFTHREMALTLTGDLSRHLLRGVNTPA